MAGIGDWGAIASILAFVIVFVVYVAAPAIRKHSIKRPVDVFFVRGDAETPTKTTMTVFANSEDIVRIRYLPKLNFQETEVKVGFEGGEQRPQILGLFDDFIAWGRGREETPDTADNHYVDAKGAYHIKRVLSRTRGGTHTLGYKIRTKGPGTFPMKFTLFTSEGVGGVTVQLKLKVVPRPDLDRAD